MYKKVNVVMLPINEKASISINKNGKMFINSFSDTVNYNLYITSDDEIKEGDCWVNKDDNSLNNDNSIVHLANNAPSCKKIITTTDSSLTYHDKTPIGENVNGLHKQLPQIPQQFIEYYVSEYNKGNTITNVMVEYDTEIIQQGESDYFNYDNGKKLNANFGTIKINSKDNTINIKPVKDSFSRKEVEKLINNFADYHDIHWLNSRTQKWIEKNL